MTAGAARRRSARDAARADARSAARLAAVQALYAIAVSGESADALLDEWAQQPLTDTDDTDDDSNAAGDANEAALPAAVRPDRVFMADVVRGVRRLGAETAAVLEGAIEGAGGLQRIETLLHAILSAAAYELVARPDVPARVVIDEYVRLARAFYDGPEPGLVNAILDRVARRVREAEMTGAPRGAADPASSEPAAAAAKRP